MARKIESAKPFSQVVHIADMLPTLMDIAGLEVPEVDGRSLKDALLYNRPLKPRPIVVANFDNQALIDWPWKIVREGSLPVVPEFLNQTPGICITSKPTPASSTIFRNSSRSDSSECAPLF